MARFRVGVDEAGRGSLVGDMIIAGFAINGNDYGRLIELGVRDSKQLTAKARASLYRNLAKIGIFSVVAVDPPTIDRLGVSKATELGILKLLRHLLGLLGPHNVESVIIDKFGKPHLLEAELRRMGYMGALVVAEKADALYPEVSAASIIAKHVRDERLRVLRHMYGVEGSGYPSDKKTVEWVEKVIASGLKYSIIRYSWITIKNIEKRCLQRTLDDFLGGRDEE